MPLPSRNEPCPCGSGLKYKRCCGKNRLVAPTAQEREAVLARLGMLAGYSPRLVPLVDGAEEWEEQILAGTLLPDEALVRLPEREVARLVDAFVELFPHEAAEARAVCDREDVAAAILLGAIFAGADDHELLAVPGEYLETLEETRPVDSIEAVASTFESWQLWSRDEGAVAEAEVAKIPEWLDEATADKRFDDIMADVTSRLYGEWHACRVARMVHKLRQQLPFEEYPRATELLAAGCARFDAEPELGKRIAASLLVDAMPFDVPLVEDELLDRRAA